MLPSTGYFKALNCPFYDSGLCERPYCHFRHVKKESQNTSNDGMESGTMLQKLVSAAVQKVLQKSDSPATPTPGPLSPPPDSVVDTSKLPNNISGSNVTYNPTPISELNKNNSTEAENNEDTVEQKKRHIPVPYTPRKPTSLPVKRPVETNGAEKPFVYNPVKYTPGCAEVIPADQYTPKGSTESTEKYLPGTETELQEYSPKETATSSSRNYVPSDKTSNKKKILEYKPTKVASTSDTTAVTYEPTPRTLVPCFSSDEEEPERKKKKLSNYLNGLDDLGPEFDILDQILDEENSEKTTTIQFKKEEININKNKEKKKEKSTEDKKINKRDHEKHKSDKKEKYSSHEKDKSSSRARSAQMKSHKSSSKSKDEKQEKKRHSSSKTSERSSKHSDSKESKHSSSKKRKEKDKSHNHKAHKSSKESKDKHRKRKEEKLEITELSDNDSCHANEDVRSHQKDEDSDEISESDEETIALECKRIFEEYVPTEKSTKVVDEAVNIMDDSTQYEYIPGKKRVSRTSDKPIKILPKATVKPDFKVGAAQAMAERLSKIREYHASRSSLAPSIGENAVVKTEIPKINTNTKIRIAHVPYASTMYAKKPIITSSSNVPSTSSTVIQTIKKGVQRIAHMPNEKFIDRPGVLEPLASKIPANIRSTYLNMMIDECLKIYLSATDAYARAQHEELATSKKCSTVQIYRNSAVLTVSRLRKELQECNGIKKSGSECNTLKTLPQQISGKSGAAGSWSIESKYKKNLANPQEFSGAKFYDNIKKWILTEQQLQDNGFPRPHTSGEKGRATIYVQKKQEPPKGLIRTCCRCKKDYTIDKKYFPAIKEECIYHPNKKYRVRGEAKYQCCSQDGTSDGCCIAPSHVYEYVDYENLKGFVKTLPPENVMRDYGVYSLDCEMCYTTHGLDLTRITVIDSTCTVVYETLIKPLHPIIDYNTRYSGITEEQMVNVTTTLLDVQATLLAMFNSKTILIGHSLESDFKALKLIHDTVIDTSVLYPHKMGPPYKRALRNLSSEYLKKIIQNSVDGHDSAEDAMVCMELLMYKLKEDLKTR